MKRFKRRMRAKDYQVWAPVRAIGEAATRTNSNDFDKMAAYLKGDDFELAGFKGLPLTFRKWNWQLRQPILLIQPAALVSVSPQEGFLHQVSVLDTGLGEDERETGCSIQLASREGQTNESTLRTTYGRGIFAAGLALAPGSA